jgi:hypothetical protein
MTNGDFLEENPDSVLKESQRFLKIKKYDTLFLKLIKSSTNFHKEDKNLEIAKKK